MKTIRALFVLAATAATVAAQGTNLRGAETSQVSERGVVVFVFGCCRGGTALLRLRAMPPAMSALLPCRAPCADAGRRGALDSDSGTTKEGVGFIVVVVGCFGRLG